MRSLFIYLKNYKKETILAPLFKMLEASFELLVPLVMAAVIDVYKRQIFMSGKTEIIFTFPFF